MYYVNSLYAVCISLNLARPLGLTCFTLNNFFMYIYVCMYVLPARRCSLHPQTAPHLPSVQRFKLLHYP